MGTLRENTKRKAGEAAMADLNNGRPCDSRRYCARPGSAWDTWYTDQYRAGLIARDTESCKTTKVPS